MYPSKLQINPVRNNQEIFEIMKQLHLLKTNQEKIRLQTSGKATELLNRYFISKPMSNLKEIKVAKMYCYFLKYKIFLNHNF